MSISTMIVQLPLENGRSSKKAVVTEYERENERAKNAQNPRLGYKPGFVNYEELSEQDKKIWDDFMQMIAENMKEPQNPDYFKSRIE